MCSVSVQIDIIVITDINILSINCCTTTYIKSLIEEEVRENYPKDLFSPALYSIGMQAHLIYNMLSYVIKIIGNVNF